MRRSGLLDGSHSSSRLCVKSVLPAVRAIASRLKNASYGRHATVNAVWAKCRLVELIQPARCWLSSASSGFRSRL